MNRHEKTEIKGQLATYCVRYGSQSKASASLEKVSSATVSQILNDNWELITDEMWRNVGSQIGWSAKRWNIVETRAYTRLVSLLRNSQDYSNVMSICAEAGSGKSIIARAFRDTNSNVYLLSCNEFWNRKLFLVELLQEMGKSAAGYTVGEMMGEVVRELKRKESPLIIMDEADKLSDQVLYFFITLYNQLEDHCGIVMMATDHLEKRVRKGLRLNKKGYKEIYSRMGRKFIPLQSANKMDITQICMANNVVDKKDINLVITDAEAHGYDLRRVKRKVHAIKQSSNNN